MAIPNPGKPVRGSTTGRPIMALLDLLGRRWTLRIGWELRDGSALQFRELQARCDSMSASVLAARLAEMREAGIVELDDHGYQLTTHGRELLEVLVPLDAWARRWARRTPSR